MVLHGFSLSFSHKPISISKLILDHENKPPPEKAFGWIVAAQGSPDYEAVLGTPPINAPLDAVRAWIVAQAKGKK
jgi:hypothetical protein